MLTDDIVALRASGTEAASNNRLTARVGGLHPECTPLKARVATAGAFVFQLRSNNVGLSTRVN